MLIELTSLIECETPKKWGNDDPKELHCCKCVSRSSLSYPNVNTTYTSSSEKDNQ